MDRLRDANWRDVLFHIFLPNRCMFCGEPIRWDGLLCGECEKKAPWTERGRCLICGGRNCGGINCRCENHNDNFCRCDLEKNGFLRLTAPFYYDLGADRAIRDMKFHGNLLNARKLGQYMADRLIEDRLDTAVDVIVPVPLYEKDLARRGYNQAEVLASWVSRSLGKPLVLALDKVRSTKKQHELNARERAVNLRNAFRIAAPGLIRGRTVLLVDDVFTTGSTARTCARTLLEAGAGAVLCLTAAKTVQEFH